jgi:hypothetical protein
MDVGTTGINSNSVDANSRHVARPGIFGEVHGPEDKAFHTAQGPLFTYRSVLLPRQFSEFQPGHP